MVTCSIFLLRADNNVPTIDNFIEESIRITRLTGKGTYICVNLFGISVMATSFTAQFGADSTFMLTTILTVITVLLTKWFFKPIISQTNLIGNMNQT